MNPLRSALPQPSLTQLQPFSAPSTTFPVSKNTSNTLGNQPPLKVPAGPLDKTRIPPPLVPQIRGRDGYTIHDSWKIALKDWTQADPSIGHLIPLKDWKQEWVEGKLGQVQGRGVKYHERRLLSSEFERYAINVYSGCPTALGLNVTLKICQET